MTYNTGDGNPFGQESAPHGDDEHHVHVVFKGGDAPTDEDRALIQDAFAEVGISDVDVRQLTFVQDSTAEWILLSIPLSAFLNSILAKAGEDAYAVVRSLFGKLFSARGRQQRVDVFDTTAKLQLRLAPDLPEDAWKALVALDLSGIAEPPALYPFADKPEVAWNSAIRRWTIYPDSLVVGGLHVSRRLPITAARQAVTNPATPPPLTTSQITEVHGYMSSAARSVVRATRARLVCYFDEGHTPADIAANTFTSASLVEAVLDDVSRDGLRALEVDYANSRAPLTASVALQQEILDIARRDPNEFGRQFKTTWTSGAPRPQHKTWTAQRLAEALVLEGVIEDMSVGYLQGLLRQEGLDLDRSAGQ